MFKHLLVPVDGSKLSLKAVDYAATLAKSAGARLTIMTVLPSYPITYAGDGYAMQPMSPGEWDKAMKKLGDEHLGKARKRLKEMAADLVAVFNEQPYEGIIATAKKRKCDVIVMASHGRRGLSALLLGSETTKVLTHSKIPVLVCR